jgi:hypothetical protein
MGMLQFRLVVVHQINIERVAVDNAEYNPPVSRYRALSSIQVAQNVREPADLVGADLARVPLLKQALQTPVSERPDHQNNVPCIGTHIKKQIFKASARSNL